MATASCRVTAASACARADAPAASVTSKLCGPETAASSTAIPLPSVATTADAVEAACTVTAGSAAKSGQAVTTIDDGSVGAAKRGSAAREVTTVDGAGDGAAIQRGPPTTTEGVTGHGSAAACGVATGHATPKGTGRGRGTGTGPPDSTSGGEKVGLDVGHASDAPNPPPDRSPVPPSVRWGSSCTASSPEETGPGNRLAQGPDRRLFRHIDTSQAGILPVHGEREAVDPGQLEAQRPPHQGRQEIVNENEYIEKL